MGDSSTNDIAICCSGNRPGGLQAEHSGVGGREVALAPMRALETMPLTHRPVDEKDIQIICGFPESEDELFFLSPKAEFPLSSSQLRDAIAQRSDSTVVELGGEVIAFANFYRWESGGRCSIGNVIVSPAARGRGVGRYLIEQMIALAFSKHQAAEIIVSCFNQNIAGLLFYQKLGFQPYAIEERQGRKGNRIALIHLRLSRNAT